MSWKSSSSIVDAVLAPSAIATLIAYHAFLCYKVRHSPWQTRMGINRQARRLWVFEMLSENHKRNVLAVQTLRNSLMESTLLATAAVLLIVAMATYFTFARRFKHLLGDGIEEGGAAAGAPSLNNLRTAIKSLSALGCFVFSLLCHLLSIRYYNSVLYMINIPLDSLVPADYIAQLLQKATLLYSLGCRTFYIAFPLLLWVFGSLPMFLCALILLHALYCCDFPPRNLAHNHSATMLQAQSK